MVEWFTYSTIISINYCTRMSNLFRDLDQRVSRLASPVISASLCDNCNIENLENPVEVIFDHSSYIQVHMYTATSIANVFGGLSTRLTICMGSRPLPLTFQCYTSTGTCGK